MESNPEEIRLENEQGIDRISDLPDLILSKILCNLPTKNAVGTSILSTRWKNLFPFGFMPNKLALHDSCLLNPRDNNIYSSSTNFTNFVDRLFNVTLSDVNSVEEIILHCHKEYDEDKAVSWVSAALRLNVRHLDLKVSLYESNPLFHSLNGCTTLVTLRLWVIAELPPSDNFCLPNLKTLHLTELTFKDDEDNSQQFMGGCPALECLSLLRCEFWNDICIRCPLLKKLVIEGCADDSVFVSKLTLGASNLETLIYDGFLATVSIVCDFKSLHTAHIDVWPNQFLLNSLSGEENYDVSLRYFNATAMIVSCCSTIIRLYLSDNTIDALHYSSVLLPTFPNLTWLSLDWLRWPILARLLQTAPNLEQLIMEEGFQEYEGGFQSFTNLLPIQPECLILHVKIIEFRVFEGEEDEIKLVEYFLKNGEVLQKLILHCLPYSDMGIQTRLLVLPRQSKTCQIEFVRE